MNGGEIISASTGDGFGNAIYIYDQSALMLSGEAKITGTEGIYLNTGCAVKVDNSFVGEAGVQWSADVKQTVGAVLPDTAGVCGGLVDGVFTSGGSFAGILRCEAVDAAYIVGVNGQLQITHEEHTWDEGIYTAPTTDTNGYTTYTCTICGHKAIVELSITAVILRPESTGLYFSGSFRVDEALTVKRQGFTLSLYNDQPVADGTDSSSLWTEGHTSVLVKNILSDNVSSSTNQNRAALPVYARAYVELTDGTYIYSEVVSANLADVVQEADKQLDSLEDAQKTALSSMYATFKETMDTWQIPNLKQENS
jgi:hypothetical protein